MEYLLEVILDHFPWILLLVFGAFAIFVEEVRITSSVIVLAAIINMAMVGVYEDGTTLSYLYKGAIDTITALTLLLLYGHFENKKAPEQAIVFILFSFSHGWLMYEVFTKQYWFYDNYESAMWVLTAAHFLVMGNYYEELYKNIKEELAVRVFGLRRTLRPIDMVRNREQRINGVGGSNRRRSLGSFRSLSYNSKTTDGKANASH